MSGWIDNSAASDGSSFEVMLSVAKLKKLRFKFKDSQIKSDEISSIRILNPPILFFKRDLKFF
jgi:hypothetical protein